MKSKFEKRVSSEWKLLGALDISTRVTAHLFHSTYKQIDNEPIQETILPKTLQETGANEDLIESIQLYNTVPSNHDDTENHSFPLQLGKNYNWSLTRFTTSGYTVNSTSTWLTDQINSVNNDDEDNTNNSNLEPLIHYL